MKTKHNLSAGRTYCPPVVESFDIAVEAGFAASNLEGWEDGYEHEF